MENQLTEQEKKDRQSKLIASLREGVAVVQMILFKEVRDHLTKNNPGGEAKQLSMLAGAITNEVFGTPNQEPQFVQFRKENKGAIEQTLLELKELFPGFVRNLTDALRIQTLCDSQEGCDGSEVLFRAKEYGYLLEDRDVPLPSTFMTLVRILGEQHNLITPPIQITPEDDNTITH